MKSTYVNLKKIRDYCLKLTFQKSIKFYYHAYIQIETLRSAELFKIGQNVLEGKFNTVKFQEADNFSEKVLMITTDNGAIRRQLN